MWSPILVLWGSTWALGADDPGLWVSQMGAIAAQPTGVLSATTVEYRAPVMRYGGAVFNNTFLGAGGRFSATPAFVDGAARVSFMPIDVLPITVEAVHTQYWRSPFGLLSYNESQLSQGSDGPVRSPRYQGGEGFAGHAWSVILSPTFQIRGGPIVAFTNWQAVWIKIVPKLAQSEPWVFEPYRGMVVGFEDRLMEHTSAVLWEPIDGQEGRALLRVGPILRGRWSTQTPDAMLAGGLGAQFKPDERNSTPTLLGVVTPYLRDPDFEGPIPFMALLATWEWD